MGRRQLVIGFGIVLGLVLGLGYASLRMTAGDKTICQVCGRAVHGDMRTVAMVGGQREVFCCPTCALSAGAQRHKTVRFDQLSDFLTGKPLRPDAAYAVEGSDVVPCFRKHEVLDRDGQPTTVAFDRCSPSIITFADRGAAEGWAAEHGGRAGSFSGLTQPLASVTP